MTAEELKEYVSCGREIEYEFNGRKYSITYGEFSPEGEISFCEFYKETTEVMSVEDLLKVERYGITVEQMLASCKEEDICIF